MTGYTQELVDRKLGFEEFALLCSRAFGALVTMRDEPLSAPIPKELKPNNFHLKALNKANADLLKLVKIENKKDREEFGRKKLKKEIAQFRKAQKERQNVNAVGQMEAVLAEVNDWNSGADFNELKSFMIQQLTDAIRDEQNSGDYYGELIAEREALSPLEAYDKAVQKERDNVAYHKQHWEQEIERTKKCNLWLKRLRDSLQK